MDIQEKSMKQTRIIDWAKKILGLDEITTEEVAHTPWSTVIKLSAGSVSYYLKQTPPDLFLEVDIIDICRKSCLIQDIPQIVASNKQLHCFLMTECGEISLRAVFALNFNVELLINGLKVYNEHQKATIPKVEVFLKASVPDWQLSEFPQLYQNLVSDIKFLEAHGIEGNDISIMQKGINVIESLSRALSNFGIPECLNHTDFHDANILYSYSSKKVSIIDLGETAITHPFFSRLALLQSVCERYLVLPHSDEYKKLYEVCFEYYLIDKKSRSRAIEIANQLLPLYLIFTQKRFLDAIELPYDVNNLLSIKQHGKINKALKLILGTILEHNGVIPWALNSLAKLGYTLKSQTPEEVLTTPWSYLVRFETTNGYVYLKQTPKLFALEPKIIQILQNDFQACVPDVIDNNDFFNCFLMKDAGVNLRHHLKQHFDLKMLCNTASQFSALQVAVSEKVQAFIDIGVPDYRLPILPNLYHALISQTDLLYDEGITDDEISKLSGMTSKVFELCLQLEAFKVKPTLVQPDFNDNNTLLNLETQTLAIIDLGEIVISHPFFSLINFLEQVKKHHGLTDVEPRFLKIRDACYKPYQTLFISNEHLEKAIKIASVLLNVYGIIYQHRFMMACGKEKLKSYQHWKLASLLKEWIALDK